MSETEVKEIKRDAQWCYNALFTALEKEEPNLEILALDFNMTEPPTKEQREAVIYARLVSAFDGVIFEVEQKNDATN